MIKKRNFHYIYSNNTDKEEYKIKKEFTIMIRDVLMKYGRTLTKLVNLITIISVLIVIFFEKLKELFIYFTQ
jgi:hypothetical protein